MERQVGEETREGVAIQLLVDISSSMEQSLAAGDGERLSRLEATKRVVEQFVRHRGDDLIGLITFARYADTLSPLTYGHDALVEIVRQLDIQERPTEDGTGYGDALALACARLDQMGQWQPAVGKRTANRSAMVRSKVVVLLTDGENNCGLHLPEEAAGLAKKWGIRVYAISMKDDVGGDTLDGPSDDEGLTDAEKLLRRLADETGGAYWRIGNATHLREVYERIDHLETSEIKTTILYHSEISPLFQYFACAAFALLLAERIMRATWLRVAEEVSR
jgi:Ca-activated chloride channel family protein